MKNKFLSALIVFLTLSICAFSLSGCSLFDFLQTLSEQIAPIDAAVPDATAPDIITPPTDDTTNNTTDQRDIISPKQSQSSKKEQEMPLESPLDDTTELKKSPSAIIEEIVKLGHSDYGYNCLDDYEKMVYNDLLEAIINFKKDFSTKYIDDKSLSTVFLYLNADYPLIDWLGSRYSYQKQFVGNMRIILTYDKDKITVSKELEAVSAATRKICDKIPSDLPDFDRAVLCHDQLIDFVQYDLKAPRASLAQGALLDGVATCIGYAKAYQYMLCSMGIETLMVYGKANEAHAWNLVKLDGNFYAADTTWDDPQNETLSYISHEYIFLDDASISTSHTILSDRNYPLPICEKDDMIYAKKKKLVVENPNIEEITAVFSRAIDYALAQESPAITIGFADRSLFDRVVANLQTGELDGVITELCKQRGLGSLLGRSINNDLGYLTYFREI